MALSDHTVKISGNTHLIQAGIRASGNNSSMRNTSGLAQHTASGTVKIKSSGLNQNAKLTLSGLNAKNSTEKKVKSRTGSNNNKQALTQNLATGTSSISSSKNVTAFNKLLDRQT